MRMALDSANYFDERDSTPAAVATDNSATAASTPLEFPSEPATPLPVTPFTVKRKRGRPSRAALEERRLGTPLADHGDTSAGSDIGTPSNTTNHPTPGGSTRGKRRGRPPAPGSKAARSRGGPSHYTQVPLDKEGNPQTVVDDEIVLEEDVDGETKVDKNGELLGGREYRCRTFTLLNRGDRLYMLSTEPARCIGFRDSYLFFQKHKQLFKIIVDEDEKYDMIARELIPHSYKGRAIGVVTARSVFREFGARIVVGGRKVTDDYWEQRERDAGAAEGELADPADRLPEKGQVYNRNQYVAWHGASAVYHTGQPSVPTAAAPARGKKKVLVTDTNWMAEHARSSSAFNTRLYQYRAQANHGVYEPHTNLVFFPAATQPTISRVTAAAGDAAKRGHCIVVEEEFRHAPFMGNGLGAGIVSELQTGYGDWDDALLDALETEEERAAVRAQVERERQWRTELFA
ncbi:chromatin remodelling complex Rsc7/Swp82 subunit-domain-containing protein [Geopyxis carbonaria]|nr:chromatin remodelling complex Rsc7/Swp82 subunit-domain-containing protein [Geopyxis carbonaria]